MSKTTSAPKKASLKSRAVKSDSRAEHFAALKAMLSKLVPPLMELSSAADRYELITPKPFHHHGVKKENGYYRAVMVKKDYVGLYLMFI